MMLVPRVTRSEPIARIFLGQRGRVIRAVGAPERVRTRDLSRPSAVDVDRDRQPDRTRANRFGRRFRNGLNCNEAPLAQTLAQAIESAYLMRSPRERQLFQYLSAKTVSCWVGISNFSPIDGAQTI